MRFAALRPTPAEAPRLLPVTVSTAGIPASGDPFEAPYAQRPAGSPDTLVFYQFDHLGNTRLAYRSLGGTRQVLHTADYYPFGKPLRTWSYSASQALRYQSTGHVERSEIPHQGIGKRDRESDAGRFLSVDPLGAKYAALSPYNYVMGNPISLIDPDGRSTSPIYNKEGEFLGTDDQGLQGDAIVMDEIHFEQGMAHNEAKAYDVGSSSLSEEQKAKMNEHYAGLPDRPDYNGVLTFYEAIKWYNKGTGEALYIDVSKLNFMSSELTVTDFGDKNVLRVNFFYKHKKDVLNRPASDINLAGVFGEITLNLLNKNGSISLVKNRETGAIDRFDFSNQDFRNVADYLYPGSPREFNIYGYKTGKIFKNKPKGNPGLPKPYEPKF